MFVCGQMFVCFGEKLLRELYNKSFSYSFIHLGFSDDGSDGPKLPPIVQSNIPNVPNGSGA